MRIFTVLLWKDIFSWVSLFGQGSQDPILAVEFHPSEPNSIIDVGKGHIQFWNLESGKLTKKNGVFDVSITTWQIYIYILISSLFFLQIYIYIDIIIVFSATVPISGKFEQSCFVEVGLTFY